MVLVNIYIDFFIILAVKKFFHLYVKYYRIILGSVFGGLCGLISLIPIPFIFSLLISFVLGLGICFIVFYDKNILTYIKTSSCFFIFSMIFSGFVLVLTEVFDINAAVIRGTVYFNISPLLLIFFTTAAYIVSTVLERLKGRKTQLKDYCRISIEHMGTEVKLLALTDTGNCLKEPFSGDSVIIAERKAVESILPREILDYLDIGKSVGGFRLVPFSSIGGKGLLPAYKPHKIYFSDSKQPIQAYLAVYKGKLNLSAVNALIDPDIRDFYNSRNGDTTNDKAF